MRIAIIGVGISGLSTAFCSQRERPGVDTTHSCSPYFPQDQSVMACGPAGYLTFTQGRYFPR